jgi:hypothetical protein
MHHPIGFSSVVEYNATSNIDLCEQYKAGREINQPCNLIYLYKFGNLVFHYFMLHLGICHRGSLENVILDIYCRIGSYTLVTPNCS